ncbi:hypothetical protein GL218_05372 [Daldinia childiae]|uniref:uncharacterized protein n=1 Tax=Daldinia childiae TaxID=326645 RepID=UPI0014460619|nr:uncharacterized protein GL218_05372 [Daldinia childiae]KAF3058642.1 hypothetical protein GL218_05372 [Daldinia childiae]
MSPQRNPIIRIPSDRFDSQLALDWISQCRHLNETGCCPSTQPFHDLYLIDCHKRTVVAVKEQTEYVALSYVWGEPNNEDTAYCLHHGEDGNSLLLPDTLPLVVTDAIIVTKRLGFQYLWVDKFCIAQHQSEVKHRQIMHMDAVYANSELTIIAAAGEDENYGLPGVSSRSRMVTPWQK